MHAALKIPLEASLGFIGGDRPAVFLLHTVAFRVSSCNGVALVQTAEFYDSSKVLLLICQAKQPALHLLKHNANSSATASVDHHSCRKYRRSFCPPPSWNELHDFFHVVSVRPSLLSSLHCFMETATKDVTDAGNRKRKMTATTPPSGLKRGSKLSRPVAAVSASVSNGVTPPVITPQGSIHTSTQFIDHQRAMLSAAAAPTPHGPVEHMPPTPAFVNRNGFSHTPDGFSSTPGSAVTPADDIPTAGGSTGRSSHAPTPSPVPRAAPLNLRNFANWDVGDRYTLVRLLGKGSYGQVQLTWDCCLADYVVVEIVHCLISFALFALSVGRRGF